MIKARITGDDGKGLGEEALLELRQDAPAAMTHAVEVLVETAKRLAGRPAAGRTSSAPGEPPLSRSGDLVKSIKGRKIRVWRKGYKRRLSWGSKLPYAATIEYGSSRVKARPFMRAAEVLARSRVDRILEDEI